VIRTNKLHTCRAVLLHLDLHICLCIYIKRDRFQLLVRRPLHTFCMFTHSTARTTTLDRYVDRRRSVTHRGCRKAHHYCTHHITSSRVLHVPTCSNLQDVYAPHAKGGSPCAIPKVIDDRWLSRQRAWYGEPGQQEKLSKDRDMHACWSVGAGWPGLEPQHPQTPAWRVGLRKFQFKKIMSY
jgi:hypothetical protein